MSFDHSGGTLAGLLDNAIPAPEFPSFIAQQGGPKYKDGYLRKLRHTGGGSPYFRFKGRVFYPKDPALQWIRTRCTPVVTCARELTRLTSPSPS